MNIENLSVNIEGDAPNIPIEIIVREGEAAKVQEPTSQELRTTLAGAWEWVRIRVEKQKFPNGQVTYHYQRRELIFDTDPNQPIGNTIIAQLVENPDLKAFQVGSGSGFTATQLKKLILSKAHVFADMDAARSLKRKLESFSYKFETEIQKDDDRKGNTKDSVKRALKFKDELPETIDVSLPLFIGEENAELVLTIEVEVDGTTPKFQFYCLELEKIMRDTAVDLIDQQLENFVGTYPCVELV